MPETTLTIRFAPAKETKGTWKFDEVVEGELEPKIGTLYVRKAALGEIGWKDGEELSVTIE